MPNPTHDLQSLRALIGYSSSEAVFGSKAANQAPRQTKLHPHFVVPPHCGQQFALRVSASLQVCHGACAACSPHVALLSPHKQSFIPLQGYRSFVAGIPFRSFTPCFFGLPGSIVWRACVVAQASHFFFYCCLRQVGNACVFFKPFRMNF